MPLVNQACVAQLWAITQLECSAGPLGRGGRRPAPKGHAVPREARPRSTAGGCRCPTLFPCTRRASRFPEREVASRALSLDSKPVRFCFCCLAFQKPLRAIPCMSTRQLQRRARTNNLRPSVRTVSAASVSRSAKPCSSRDQSCKSISAPCAAQPA